jgi:site-specific DNA-adenine methylase
MQMNQEQKTIHSKLKVKVEELISAYEKLKEENLKLKEHLTNLEDILQEREIAYMDLDKKYNQQQLAKAFAASSEDAHDAKIKVNRIVREIDQCIALLNR